MFVLNVLTVAELSERRGLLEDECFKITARNRNSNQTRAKQSWCGKIHLCGRPTEKLKCILTACSGIDAKWAHQTAVFARRTRQERILSEAHPVYNLEMWPSPSRVLMMCEMWCWSHRQTLEDSCDFTDSSAERQRHSTHLLSAFDELLRQLLPWPTFAPSPLLQTHPASLHRSITTSVWHLLMGLSKMHFSLWWESLSGTLNRLCIQQTAAPLSDIQLVGRK